MKKILPTSVPLIGCYPQHSFYMSIISEKKECLPWIFSNYSNIFIDNNGFCDFFVKTPEYVLYPWFQGSQRICRDFLLSNKNDFIEFIRENIISDYYIWLYIDEFYLPCSSEFGKNHFVHSIMISGFDDLNKTFKIHGYYNKSKYSAKNIDYNDLKFSFYNVNAEIDFKSYIHLIKYNENYNLENFVYNTTLFKQQLICHYNSIFLPLLNQEDAYNSSISENLTTGLNVYDKLIDFLNLGSLNVDITYDHRPLYVLLEHKKFMLLKLEYLKSQAFLIFSDDIFKKYELLKNSIEKQLVLYIKCSLTKNEEIMERIIKALKVIKNDEKDILELMLKELDNIQ
ncbi:hypothetical protein PQ460_10605 [Paenibacillus sp. KACC 21273]|uniref:hypothetical protein n=1 Tax=Paenibacillus sp. KACC 21273 TaxID=3025665 RepID=UPI002365BC24|nr:hypothetical protein [Paenibacillus sp. KACC 21273]WDF52834.1 hypothetical protein PQ460_10605 [Paenibacillus sp. KACC 21273]